MSLEFPSEQDARTLGLQNAKNILNNLKPDTTLDALRNIIKDHRKLQESAGVELAASLQRIVESHGEALRLMNKANSVTLFSHLENAQKVCPTTSQQTRRELLAQAHIQSTIDILKPFTNIPQTLDKLRQDLNNPNEFAHAVTRALNLFDGKNKLMKRNPSLIGVLQPLDELEKELDNYLWTAIENCIEVAQREPASLIRIVKVLKNTHSPEVIKQRLAEGVKQRLASRMNTTDLEQLATRSSEAINDIPLIKTAVIPCFPAEYNLEQFFLDTYRSIIEGKMKEFILDDIDNVRKSPGLIVLVSGWIENYTSAISKYWPDIAHDFQMQSLISEMKLVMPQFLEHTDKVLSEWLQRVRDNDVKLDKVPELAGNRQPLTSSYPEEMYTMINNQISFVSNRLGGELLIEVFRLCTEKLISQKNKEVQAIDEILLLNDPELQVPALCIKVNNSQRCASHSSEMREMCKSMIGKDEGFLNRIDRFFDKVHTAFVELTDYATRALALSILKSAAEATIGVLFVAKWTSNRPPATAFATLEEYQEDVSVWLSGDFFFRRFKKFYYELYLVGYMERLAQVISVLEYQSYVPDFLDDILSIGPSTSYHPDLLVNKLGIKAPPTKLKKEIESILNQQFEACVGRDIEDFRQFLMKEPFQVKYENILRSFILIKASQLTDISELKAAVQSLNEDYMTTLGVIIAGLSKNSENLIRQLNQS
jgi:hypothetical protein